MKPTMQLLTAIAREHLGIETLETRHRDSLNFHIVIASGVKKSLRAAYEAGVNASAQSSAGTAILQEVREALERAELLMRRVHEGDHQALESLSSAAKQARGVLAKAKPGKTSINEFAADLPIVTVEVRSGLIEDMDATIPVHVVIEDWDITDFDTEKKPSRSVWTLNGGLSGAKAEKLRRLIADD